MAKYRNVLEPVLHDLGGTVLAELSAPDVRAALARFARTRSTETVRIARLSLERAIRYAEANDLVARNVAALVEVPKGGDGRPAAPRATAAVLAHARRMSELIQRGQESGDLDPTLPPSWLLTASLALGRAADEEVKAGRMTIEQATHAMHHSVLRLLGAPDSS